MKSPKRKLLLIDDERDLVQMLEMRLRASGRYAITTAFDGAAGLAQAEKIKPEIILLDTYMPVLDGWEVCRRLKANPKTAGALVLIMTAGYTSKTAFQANEAGAAGVIAKPFNYADLAATIQSLEKASIKPAS